MCFEVGVNGGHSFLQLSSDVALLSGCAALTIVAMFLMMWMRVPMMMILISSHALMVMITMMIVSIVHIMMLVLMMVVMMLADHPPHLSDLGSHAGNVAAHIDEQPQHKQSHCHPYSPTASPFLAHKLHLMRVLLPR